jgi:hypothetical protein
MALASNIARRLLRRRRCLRIPKSHLNILFERLQKSLAPTRQALSGVPLRGVIPMRKIKLIFA